MKRRPAQKKRPSPQFKIPSVHPPFFLEAVAEAQKCMGKRDPTAYSFIFGGEEYAFTDTPLNQFTFALRHFLGERMDCFIPILIRFYASGKLLDTLRPEQMAALDETKVLVMRRDFMAKVATAPLKNGEFNPDDFVEFKDYPELVKARG